MSGLLVYLSHCYRVQSGKYSISLSLIVISLLLSSSPKRKKKKTWKTTSLSLSLSFAHVFLRQIRVHVFGLPGQAVKLHGWNHHTQWPLEEAPWNVTASPTDAQLDAWGRADLRGAIQEHHGGLVKLRASLGWEPGSNPPSVKLYKHWVVWENVECEMPGVLKACKVEGRLPTQSELRVNGYSSLAEAISEEHGG